MKKVLLLGASGSIGTQTIDVINASKGEFVLSAFSVGNRSEAIEPILKEHKAVTCVYLIDKNVAKKLAKKYPNIKFYSGKIGLAKITKKADYDMCVDALVGFAGLEPAVIALKRNKIHSILFLDFYLYCQIKGNDCQNQLLLIYCYQ